MNSTRNLIERDSFTDSRRQIRLRSLSTFRVICARPFASRLALNTPMYERRLEHIGDKLQCRNISPQRLERIRFRRLETLHQFAMTPEDACFARTSEEAERLIGMFVD